MEFGPNGTATISVEIRPFFPNGDPFADVARIKAVLEARFGLNLCYHQVIADDQDADRHPFRIVFVHVEPDKPDADGASQ